MPARRKRIEATEALLREALDRLEKGEPADVGFAEDAHRRVRIDKMECDQPTQEGRRGV